MKNKTGMQIQGGIVDISTGKFIWDWQMTAYKDEKLEHISIPLKKEMAEIEEKSTKYGEGFLSKMMRGQKDMDPKIAKLISDNFEDLI